VCRLFYLKEKEFLFLKGLRDRFVGRVLKGWKRPSEAKKPLHKKNGLFKSPLRDVSNLPKGHPATGYEPSWVFETRDSRFWAWRRTKELLSDWFGEASGYEEALTLMRS
jgi:hypothetical protein